MSFMLTTEQIENETKTVTRRNGWAFIKEGDTLQPVKKCQGLKRGEKIKPISPPTKIQVVGVRREKLNLITKSDCIAEGFPDMSPDEFVAFYCKHNKCNPDSEVTRIEFRYIPF